MFHLSPEDERERLKVGDLARTHHGNIVMVVSIHATAAHCDIYFTNTANHRTGYPLHYLRKI
jgi:hypothetical protein